ncbi:hypothetical protein EV356DRAFT_507285 [Viridothelium virens]|uniref:Formamidopyrimidine-DNA glycosylase catalytic domain-containing protein n=1 Tax=Viridothelium virens TaxID=1048519 RepID=A0A6A6HJA9_VIRVR|nr:hypothetical protein EV356DRAFT_507285 [Viridothelium virens]
MPEIGEVARIVYYLKKHAVGRTIDQVEAQEDAIVYGKVDCSASQLKKDIVGKKIVDAKQQGKYFWLELDSLPHPLMHFGMSGWMKFSNDDTAYYKPQKDKGISDEEWPPKYWKFVLQLSGEPECEVAFVDPRRLGRIRLIYVDAHVMRNSPPLKQNGPDPVIDKDVLTIDWLAKKMQSKRVPIKALLLDQANISGVGNWVADEILYQAKLHPEQYCNTFSDEQVKTLHDSLVNVCTTAVDTLAESSKFPETWLMKHRWGKGKEGGDRLPNGERIIHLKVGGRTSAVVPSVQKKTGAVAGDIKEKDDAKLDTKPKKRQKRQRAQADESGGEEAEEERVPRGRPKKAPVKKEVGSDEADGAELDDGDVEDSTEEQKPVSKRGKSNRKTEPVVKDEEDGTNPAPKGTKKSKKITSVKKEKTGSNGNADGEKRRSGRLSAK